MAAEHRYSAAHLRPLSIVHISAEAVGNETKISWIPRKLDGSDDVDPSAQVEISWPGGVELATGTSARLPIAAGSDTLVSFRPTDPVGGDGLVKTILV